MKKQKEVVITQQARTVVNAVSQAATVAVKRPGMTFETAIKVAQEMGLVERSKGRFGGTTATVDGMAFAGLTGEIQLPESRTLAAIERAKRQEAAAKAELTKLDNALTNLKRSLASESEVPF
mgnify:CR=1 FL=1